MNIKLDDFNSYFDDEVDGRWNGDDAAADDDAAAVVVINWFVLCIGGGA